MNDLSVAKQVSKIEYVGPHQIQTTSSVSMNFTVIIDARSVKLTLLDNSKEVEAQPN